MKKWERREINELARVYIEQSKREEPEDAIHDAFCAGFLVACSYDEWTNDFKDETHKWSKVLREDAASS